MTAPASPPSASMRAPERNACRPVKSDSSAPTANSATAVTPIAAASALGPGATMNGASGSRAPAAKETNDEIAAPMASPARRD